MKRVLHIICSCSLSSGVAHVVMNYYRYVDKGKVQFDFLVYKRIENGFEDEIHRLGGNIYCFGWPSIRSMYKQEKEFENLLSKHNDTYVAVHLHEVYMNGIYLPIAKKHGIACIVHSHLSAYSDKPLSAIRNYFMCIPIKRNADFYFACSKLAGDFLYGKKAFASEKGKLLYNAIDCEKYKFNKKIRAQIRSELDIKDYEIIIGNIGRFAQQKNHNFLVDIFVAYQKLNLQSKLLLVGQGRLLEKIKQKVLAQGLEDYVIFAGQVNNPQDYLQAMDVVVMPSLFEGLCIAAVEAQANGLPCVCSISFPQETEILPTFQRMSLNESPNAWATAIVKSLDIGRTDNAVHVIEKAGYNINMEADKLEKFYTLL